MGEEATGMIGASAPNFPYLLAHLGGERPAAPEWFETALASEPERRTADVAGCPIELLCWGDQGSPGLLFLHGNGAHADWWSFIAPFFADRFRVAAISWSGMGGSGWRSEYSMSHFVLEVMAGAEAAGLFDAPRPPIMVAHSFGASPMLECLARFGDRFALGVAVDKGIPLDSGPRVPARPPRPASRRLFPTIDEGLARFRLSPAQPCDNLFIIDWIARRSLREVFDPELGLNGWGWAFDPVFRGALGMEHIFRTEELIRGSGAPLAFLFGGHSSLVTEPMRQRMRAAADPNSYFAMIEEADHHVMLDQPLAFVNALERCLELMRVTPHQSRPR
jgi:pimeloyl-ACP methyl ester carboxylesterase